MWAYKLLLSFVIKLRHRTIDYISLTDNIQWIRLIVGKRIWQKNLSSVTDNNTEESSLVKAPKPFVCLETRTTQPSHEKIGVKKREGEEEWWTGGWGGVTVHYGVVWEVHIL